MLVNTVTYRVNMFVSKKAEVHVHVLCTQRFFYSSCMNLGVPSELSEVSSSKCSLLPQHQMAVESITHDDVCAGDLHLCLVTPHKDALGLCVPCKSTLAPPCPLFLHTVTETKQREWFRRASFLLSLCLTQASPPRTLRAQLFCAPFEYFLLFFYFENVWRRRRRGSTFKQLHTKNASPVLERLSCGWQHLQHKCPEKHSSPSERKTHWKSIGNAVSHVSCAQRFFYSSCMNPGVPQNATSNLARPVSIGHDSCVNFRELVRPQNKTRQMSQIREVLWEREPGM